MFTRRGLLASALLFTLMIPASARSVELRIATQAPRGSTWMKGLEAGAADIAKATAGRVKLRYYPNGVQGDEREIVKKMRSGRLDGAAVTGVGMMQIYEGAALLELPRFYENFAEQDYVRGKLWNKLSEEFAKQGFVLSEPYDLGWEHFYSKVPIRTVSDLRDAKTWERADDPVSAGLLRELNIKGVKLETTRVLSGLSSGRVEAVYASPAEAESWKWSAKVSHMTGLQVRFGTGALVFSNKVWRKITPSDRKLIQKLLRKNAAMTRQAARRDNDSALKQLHKKGVEVVDASPELVRDLDDAASKVWKGMVGKLYSQGELDAALKLRSEFRATASR